MYSLSLRDLTTMQTHLQHYDIVLKLIHGLAPTPIRHVTTVTQDNEYNCGICVLMTAIIYFYHPTPTIFSWHTLNYSGLANYMRSVIISILATGQPPRLSAHHTPQSPIPHPEPTHTHEEYDPVSLSSKGSVHLSASQPSSTVRFTKVAIWNIDRQASYDGPIKACVHDDLDFLYCTEPAEHMTPGTQVTASLISTADKAGYILYVTTHCHTYIRQATLHTRLISQYSSYNGRLYIFVFQGSNMHHTAILCLYEFQRGHRDHSFATAENAIDTA